MAWAEPQRKKQWQTIDDQVKGILIPSGEYHRNIRTKRLGKKSLIGVPAELVYNDFLGGGRLETWDHSVVSVAACFGAPAFVQVPLTDCKKSQMTQKPFWGWLQYVGALLGRVCTVLGGRAPFVPFVHVPCMQRMTGANGSTYQ